VQSFSEIYPERLTAVIAAKGDLLFTQGVEHLNTNQAIQALTTTKMTIKSILIPLCNTTKCGKSQGE
jgi:hypothetical protein